MSSEGDSPKIALSKACNDMAPYDPFCYCVLDAIFTHDSAWATVGVGKWAKNPGNLRCLGEDSTFDHQCEKSPGNGYFAKFDDLETGIEANVDLYVRKYMGKTPEAITRIWAGSPQSKEYWDAIKSCYQL